jgi:hypothetical protein
VGLFSSREILAGFKGRIEGLFHIIRTTTQLHFPSKSNMTQGKVRVRAYCGPETGLNAWLGAKKLMDALVI